MKMPACYLCLKPATQILESSKYILVCDDCVNTYSLRVVVPETQVPYEIPTWEPPFPEPRPTPKHYTFPSNDESGDD